MHFVLYRDDKTIEQLGVRDDLGMMQQLGVITPPGQGEVSLVAYFIVRPNASAT